MTHEPRRDELLDLALGLLEPEPARQLEAHAAGCAACRVELAALRQTRALVAGLPQVEAPARGASAVLAAARQAAQAAAARSRPRWAAPGWLWGGTLGLAGAAAMAVLVLRTTPLPAPLGELAAAPPPASTPSARLAEERASPAKATAPPAEAAALERRDQAERKPAELLAAASPPQLATEPKAGPAGAARVELAEAMEAGPAQATGRAKAAPAARRAALASAVGGPAAPAAALRAAAVADASGAPPCRLEQRRRLRHDDAGRVVGRVREGRYPAAEGDVPLRVEERFDPEGRLRGATVSAGDRLITVSDADLEAGRLEPLPGVVLARTALEAAQAPPRCEPHAANPE